MTSEKAWLVGFCGVCEEAQLDCLVGGLDFGNLLLKYVTFESFGIVDWFVQLLSCVMEQDPL